MDRRNFLVVLVGILFSAVNSWAKVFEEVSASIDPSSINPYMLVYEELKNRHYFLPKNVFTEELELAQEFIESTGDPAAVSEKGARGVMQNTESSVKDVCGYELSKSDIGKLPAEKRAFHIAQKRDGNVGHDVIGLVPRLAKKRVIKFKGPRKINEHELVLLMDQMPIPECSIAFSRLYFIKLFDQKNGYGVGRQEFEKGNIAKTQFELLGAYNGGRKRIVGKSVAEWPKESRDYARQVFLYMRKIKNIRKKDIKTTKQDIFKILAKNA